MNLKTKTLILAVPVALAMSPVAEELDLTPRFTKGQTLIVTNTMSMEMGLDDVSALMDGQEMLAGAVEFDMEMAMTQELTEKILEVRDGKIAKMNVTTDAMDVEVSGEVSAMGDGDSLDESVESPTVGRTVQLTIDQYGEVSRKDITEDTEPLGDAELATVTHRSHFELLSPSEKVEEGKEFEIAPEWKEMLEQAMSGMDTSELPPEAADAMEGIVDSAMDAMDFAATGKVTKVEDGVATIEYEMDMDMNIDDLMDMIMGAMPPEASDQMPPINAMLEMSMNMTGTGTYDIEFGQYTSMEMGGEFEIVFSGDADLGGATGEASATMSGELTIASTISTE